MGGWKWQGGMGLGAVVEDERVGREGGGGRKLSWMGWARRVVMVNGLAGSGAKGGGLGVDAGVGRE